MNLKLSLCIIIIIISCFAQVHSKRPPRPPRKKVERGRAQDKCVYIVTIANGSVTYEDEHKLNHIGMHANFHCDEGFKLEGRQKIYCNPTNRTWDQEIPKCKEWKCSELVSLSNGKIHWDDKYYLPGGKANFTCNYGYRLKGKSEITCLDSAKWDESPPECESDECPPIEYFHHGKVMKYSRLRGSVVKFVCDSDSTLYGPESSQCIQVGLNLEWSPPVPSCTSVNNKSKRCKRIIDIPNATIKYSRGDCTEVNTRVVVRCNKGFRVKGTSKGQYVKMICQEDGEDAKWSTIPVCEDIQCDPIQVMPHANVRSHSVAYTGTKMHVYCDRGYQLIGKQSPICMANHKWDSYPKCVKYQCKDLDFFEHGYIEQNTYSNEVYPLNKRAFLYRCDKGYQLRGSVRNACIKPKPEWQNDHPKCVFGYAVCVAHGDPHYRTFDRQKITFMGSCKYTLASTCDKASAQGLEDFNVEGKNFAPAGNRKVSFTKYLTVDIYGYRIQMGPWEPTIIVRVNGVSVNLPVTSLPNAPGLTIKFSGRFLELRTVFGLVVRLDQYYKADITVPSEYVDIDLCGVCGNFNMDPADDLLTKDGKSISYLATNKRGQQILKYDWHKLGNSWQVPGPESETGCLSTENPEPNCEGEKETYIKSVCGKMIDKNGMFGAFIDKLGVMAAEEDYHSCTFDACLMPEPMEPMCDALTDFADKGNDQGIFVQWRTETFCPLKCRDNFSVYKPKTSACPKTCGNLDEGPLSCPEDDVEGCECIEKHVLNSNGQCIHKSECGCTNDKGFYYPVGASYPADDCSATYVCQADGTFRRDSEAACHEHAECLNKGGVLGCHCKEGYEGDGVAECKSNIRPSTCIAAGDPYYTLFDNARLPFQGKHQYQMVKPCSDEGVDNWGVYVQNRQTETGERTYAHQVIIEVYNHKIIFNEFASFLIDGITKEAPFEMLSSPFTVTHGNDSEAGSIILTAPELGFKVMYDGRGISGRHITKITVSNPKYRGKLCGLCGNWNDDMVDDMIPNGKTEVGDVDDVGNSWQSFISVSKEK